MSTPIARGNYIRCLQSDFQSIDFFFLIILDDFDMSLSKSLKDFWK
jgi:hypothetical protein